MSNLITDKGKGRVNFDFTQKLQELLKYQTRRGHEKHSTKELIKNGTIKLLNIEKKITEEKLHK